MSRQLPARLQADLLGRLAITLRAGIDLRKAWASEVKRMPARWQSHLSLGTRSLDDGEMLSDALSHTGLFPPLVVGMVAVGDQTGKDVETLKELSRVINHRVETTSRLRSSLILPAVQFVLALAVVGLLILISGMIELDPCLLFWYVSLDQSLLGGDHMVSFVDSLLVYHSLDQLLEMAKQLPGVRPHRWPQVPDLMQADLYRLVVR